MFTDLCRRVMMPFESTGRCCNWLGRKKTFLRRWQLTVTWAWTTSTWGKWTSLGTIRTGACGARLRTRRVSLRRWVATFWWARENKGTMGWGIVKKREKSKKTCRGCHPLVLFLRGASFRGRLICCQITRRRRQMGTNKKKLRKRLRKSKNRRIQWLIRALKR